MCGVGPQSNQGGIESEYFDHFIDEDELRSRNRTKVGLKASIVSITACQHHRRNRTKVGLKARLRSPTMGGRGRRNRTKVGLKVLRPRAYAQGKDAPQSNQGGIESSSRGRPSSSRNSKPQSNQGGIESCCPNLPQADGGRRAAIEPRWD